MAANTAPIYSKVGVIAWATLTAANTAKDGTGTTGTIFTADATNGGRVEKVKVRALGTNVATVLRIFINNGSSSATAANNTLFMEVTCAATTLSEVAALADIEVLLNLVLPPGYKLLVAIGTTVAAGLAVTAVGGAY
ncbi:MAG: hypothetical protein IAE86_06475 [Burkholderiaceae bacterium]|nr:hypothetical protein [Burkholderiaceae bacterium]